MWEKSVSGDVSLAECHQNPRKSQTRKSQSIPVQRITPISNKCWMKPGNIYVCFDGALLLLLLIIIMQIVDKFKPGNIHETRLLQTRPTPTRSIIITR